MGNSDLNEKYLKVFGQNANASTMGVQGNTRKLQERLEKLNGCSQPLAGGNLSNRLKALSGSSALASSASVLDDRLKKLMAKDKNTDSRSPSYGVPKEFIDSCLSLDEESFAEELDEDPRPEIAASITHNFGPDEDRGAGDSKTKSDIRRRLAELEVLSSETTLNEAAVSKLEGASFDPQRTVEAFLGETGVTGGGANIGIGMVPTSSEVGMAGVTVSGFRGSTTEEDILMQMAIDEVRLLDETYSNSYPETLKGARTDDSSGLGGASRGDKDVKNQKDIMLIIQQAMDEVRLGVDGPGLISQNGGDRRGTGEDRENDMRTYRVDSCGSMPAQVGQEKESPEEVPSSVSGLPPGLIFPTVPSDLRPPKNSSGHLSQVCDEGKVGRGWGGGEKSEDVWCCVCLEDAQVHCPLCEEEGGGEVEWYCHRCWRDVHSGEPDLEKHRAQERIQKK
ncbi:unnamed protein product [Choristocarpus tenellus]